MSNIKGYHNFHFRKGERPLYSPSSVLRSLFSALYPLVWLGSLARISIKIKPGARGALEITDAIQYMVTNQFNVKARIVQGYWADTGKQSDMLDTNRLVLERLRESKIEGFCDSDSTLDGRIVVEAGAEIINDRVRGPVIIGAGCRIVNSYVGPFSAIDKNCVITNSEIEYSIVMENSKILDIDHRIEDSLIGRNVVIEKSSLKPKAHKLLLGDNSHLGIL